MKYSRVLLILVVLMACGRSDKEPLGPYIYHVTYEVTGAASTVDIDYTDVNGATRQVADVTLPWKLQFDRAVGEFVSITATSKVQTGDITAAIYRSGIKFKKETVPGPWAVVSVSGKLP